ncbi:hypothetical protein [Mycolicibacterium sphagni]|nr:hypothetical protein [Mycolicibacterium sphagni]
MGQLSDLSVSTSCSDCAILFSHLMAKSEADIERMVRAGVGG